MILSRFHLVAGAGLPVSPPALPGWRRLAGCYPALAKVSSVLSQRILAKLAGKIEPGTFNREYLRLRKSRFD
jgi:hypothetical protein